MSTGALQGRADEQRRFTRLLVARSRGGLVFSGPPGVGKTRLADDLVRSAAGYGWRSVSVRCNSSSVDLPLGAFAPVLPPEVTRLSEGLPLLVQARQAVAALGDGHPLVLSIDDVQFLDNVSALLVAQLVDAHEALLLGTHRTGEYVPSPVAELWHRGLVDLVPLGGLDRPTTDAMAADLAGAPLDPAAAERVWQLTTGNALHVSVLMRSAKDAGLLETGSGGALRFNGPLARATGLVDFVEAKLSLLGDDARAACALVAVGEPLGLPDVELLAGSSALMEVEERGFVSVTTDGQREVVRMAHPLFGEVLRAGMSRTRARRAFRDLAELVTKYGARRRDDALRVATWAIDGGFPLEAGALIDAARRARFAWDHTLAERLARAAFAAQPSFAAAQVLADVHWELGRAEEAEAALAVMAELACSDGERTLVAAGLMQVRFWLRGDRPGAVAALESALARVTATEHRYELEAARAAVWAHSSDPHRALLETEPLIELPMGRAFMQATLARSQALRYLGRQAESVEVLDRAVTGQGELGKQMMLVAVPLLVALRHKPMQDQGFMAEAKALAVELRTTAVAGQDRTTQAMADLCLAQSLDREGNLDEAIALLEEGDEIMRQFRNWGMGRWVKITLVRVAAKAGQVELAQRVLDQLAAIGEHPANVYDTELPRSRAWLRIAQHDPLGGRHELLAAAAQARAAGQVPVEADTLHDLVRVGGAELAVDRLADLSREHPGVLMSLVAAHARAAVRDDAAALTEVSERFEEMTMHAVAAEVALAASQAAARAGDQRLANRLGGRAADLAARCDSRSIGLSLPTIPVPLTRREQEIAQLAVSGLASKLIAERLFLSTRTVDNHLARVYDKLGVRGRAELAGGLRAASA